MSQKICRKLRKVTTPYDGPELQSAAATSLSPAAKCTARVIIQDAWYPVQFVVLPCCPHDIILGWDFLCDHGALIDCSADELFLCDMPRYDEHHVSPPLCKLYATGDICIPPRSTAFISLKPGSSAHDLAHIVVHPQNSSLAAKCLIAPSCVCTISDGEVAIPVTNISSCSVLLPTGAFIGTSDLLETPHVIAVLDPSARSSPTSRPPAQLPQQFDAVFNSMVSPHLDPPDRHRLLALLQKHSSLFDIGAAPLGVAQHTEHRIDTGDAAPLRQRPYRVSASERAVIEKEVDQMLSKGIIQPSSSPWASPVVLVTKKDGSIRFCIDYRRINRITRKDVYPMPRIDDALDTLRGASHFSSLDLRSGYWQIPMAEADKEKTAFATPDGLFEFNVMPFGLCNAPATFERMMDSVLRGLRWKICLCYLDDIVVFAPNFSEHIERLGDIFRCLTKAGLQLNSKKCKFGYDQIKVLGHVVSREGIAPDPEKVKAVSSFPQPTTLKDLRSFIGLCSYFRRFIRGFADIAAPLTCLLKKNCKFSWSSEHTAAFSRLKTALTSAPILSHFDPSALTELHTDASGVGIGAVLAQRLPDAPMECAVAFASRTLSLPEKNYSTTDKECLAVVWAVKKFRPYLYGRPFVILTDHHALCWLTTLKDPSGRLGRWVLSLQQFDYTIKYKSGRKHRDADALSRCPLPTSPPTVPDAEASINALSLPPVDLPALQEHQLNDPDFSPIICHLNGTVPSSDRKLQRKCKNFKLLDATLYKRNYNPEGQRLLLAIPRNLRHEVLRSLHDDATAGHLSFYKTYDRIRRRYFWPRLYSTVYKYVSSCIPCQRRKPSPPSAGLLQPLLPPHAPFDRVGIDLLGPFPASPTGNKWVVVAIDHLTRYVETAPLRSGSSEEIANFFIHSLLLRHGAPRVLVSDRGRPFLARLLQDILQACSVVHRPTSAYHPQTNGLTERFNHTLGDMLALYVQSDQTNWDRLLPYLTFAYNTAVQSTTHFTPFRLVFGRDPVCNVDTVFPYHPSTEHNTTLAEATSRTEECRQLARCRTFEQQSAAKLRYDEHRRHVHYNNGDLVWLWVPIRKPGLCEKLICKYLGPYRVLAKNSDVNYAVEPVDPPSDRRRRSKENAHVSRLKPYKDPSSARPSARMASSSEGERCEEESSSRS